MIFNQYKSESTVLESLKRGQHKNEKIGTGVVSISDNLKETIENIQNISKSGGVLDPPSPPTPGPLRRSLSSRYAGASPGWQRVFFVTRDGTQIISVMRDQALI